MNKETFAVLIAAVMSAVGVCGDYFLKRASAAENPLTTRSFLVGLALYSTTAFAWVHVMQHLKLATIGVIYSVCMILMLTAMGVYFGETLSRSEMAGVALAVAAILLLMRFGE